MKKILLASIATAAMLSLAACSSNSNQKSSTSSKNEKVTFHALDGDVKIPKNPQRIAVQNYPDEVATLGGNVVGTDSWAFPNPYLSANQKKNMKDLGAPSFNLEKLIAQKPDLIITVDKDQVADYQKIAPTVLVNYQDLNNQTKSLNFFAKLLNRESDKTKFEKQFTKTADEQKAKLSKAGIKPSNLTASILELQENKIYAYGDDFARGGQTLTTGLGFKESPEMSALSKGAGYAEVNAESLSKFDADYIFVDYKSADKAQFTALENNPTWKNLKAVKEGHVITMDYNKVYFFSGPTATEKQLSMYTDAILKASK